MKPARATMLRKRSSPKASRTAPINLRVLKSRPKQTPVATSGTPLSSPTVATPRWAGSAWQTESTFHQLAPYIGKTKSSMASFLVERHSKKGDVLYDPFSGCGTVALEGWLAGRHVIANDLSPYAHLLTKAKLFPYKSLDEALTDLKTTSAQVGAKRTTPDLRTVPAWVRGFFHPETLREIITWTSVLKAERRHFLLACLLGILHHQRPGFLSFPSSHTVPYLRTNVFPRAKYPELYEYRSLVDRLEAKVRRAFRRVPELSYEVTRHCHSRSAAAFMPSTPVDVILTSPPYMRQLDYGRDNRLRLWFLGCKDWNALDESVSPGEEEFLRLMARCFKAWRSVLKPEGNCVLIVGNECSRVARKNLPAAVIQIATKDNGYTLVSQHTDAIPNERRVRRGLTGSTTETIIVLRSTKQGHALRGSVLSRI